MVVNLLDVVSLMALNVLVWMRTEWNLQELKFGSHSDRYHDIPELDILEYSPDVDIPEYNPDVDILDYNPEVDIPEYYPDVDIPE